MIRPITAEFLGTALLAAVVLGAGQMATPLGLSGLLPSSLATGAALFVLITILGPVSGAHLNPAVTLIFALRGEIRTTAALAYGAVQLVGAAAGAVLVHAMFALPLLQIATLERTGANLWLSEVVATFGLVLTILGAIAARSPALPAMVGSYIMAGYWFTASTSFANPALLVSRSLTDTASGIRPVDAPAYAIAQFAGALAAYAVARLLFSPPSRASE